MPVEHFGKGGATATGQAIGGFRGRVIMSAIKLYLTTGMKANRAYTPANMRSAASDFTGKQYPRSRKGLETAYADMCKLAEGKSLDELGQVEAVNAAVGGIAADLQPNEE